MEIRKATRTKAKLRLGISAPSGGGKTYSALKLAFGMGGKVGVIDTENGSADLYAHLGEYDVITLTAPFSPARYREAIKQFEKSGYDTIIIDSLSHAWASEGGILDKKAMIDAGGGNSYANWRKVTPEHDGLVSAMLQSTAHIIATMRSKQEYVLQGDDKGKQVPIKVGMAPVQREGMEYEFTLFFDLDAAHNARATKDRTEMFDKDIFKISEETGKKVMAWLNTGVDRADPIKDVENQTTTQPSTETKQEDVKVDTYSIKGVVESGKEHGGKYGIKILGKKQYYVTHSLPAFNTAMALKGKRVDISYKTEMVGDKQTYSMVSIQEEK